MAVTRNLSVVLAVADSESSTQYELGECVTNIEVDWSIFDQPGKLTFEFVEGKIAFYEGSNVVLTVNGIQFFNGYVFKRQRTAKGIQSVTCYDRLRYLQNKDTQVFENQSVTEIFTILCQEQQLPFQIVSSGDWKTAPIAHDNKSLYAMIKRALDEEFIATQKYLIVRDYQGTLQLVDISTLTTNCFVGDDSLLTGYDFTSSIDSETYNYVKIVQEDKEKSVRNVYITQDSSTIYKWGRLQYFEKMDEKANEAQIKAKADQMLKLYNRKTKTLRVECLGDLAVREGCGVGVGIKALGNEGIVQMQYTFVSKCTHKFSKEVHTMQLDLEVV